MHAPPAGYPYPPPAGTVNAPGGFAATPAGAPPGVYDPASAGSSAYQPSGYPAAGQQASPFPSIPEPEKPFQQQQPGAYPGTQPGAYPAGAYPGHYAFQPAGYHHQAQPVTGYPAGPAHGPPVGGMAVEATPSQGGKAGCCGPEGCTVGWVLFGIGFIIPLCWAVGMFIPFCTKVVSDKRAGIASSIALTIYVIIIIAVAVTSPR
eukprot:gene2509-2814_t